MAPAPLQTSSTTSLALSPAELAYLHGSLSLTPPVRPDGRSPAQFRPLVAETDVLPSANGSARVCFADGTEAIAGVKAEVEAGTGRWDGGTLDADERGQGDVMGEEEGAEDTANEPGARRMGKSGRGEDSWVEMSIEVPGLRDDDTLPVFLAAMLTEAILADGRLRDRLWINRRFHWRLYVDILLLSPPSTYPLPLLSMTTHLALRTTCLPALISQGDEDPLFADDWAAATPLYPAMSHPPVTLLVASIGPNALFDPSGEEIAVAEAVIAVSVADSETAQAARGKGEAGRPLRLLALRTVDPPSRHTPAGVPNALNTATGGAAPDSASLALAVREVGAEMEPGVWRAPRGGMKRAVVAQITRAVVQSGGVGEEVLRALSGFIGGDTG